MIGAFGAFTYNLNVVQFSSEEATRVAQERNLWLATVRPNGRPHLVPIWYVEVDGAWYLCTESKSVKARNLQAEPRCSWSLENGDSPLVIEGRARSVAPSQAVIAAFRAKFDWDIENDPDNDLVFELTPIRKVMGKLIAD